VDAVLIMATTKSNEPVRQAAQMSRKRGRIVLIGVAGLEFSRADFYEKELSFQVSCSYGPGRYDSDYEEKGFDYPVGFVRWTEQRNFEAVLDMMADGRLDVAPLISHRFPIEDAEQAYALVGSAGPSLGILLSYPGIDITEAAQTVSLATSALGHGPRGAAVTCSRPKVSFLGSGNYATAVLIPAFKAGGAELWTVACSGGVSGFHAGRKYGFTKTTTDSNQLFNDAESDAVVITTRHDSHARFVRQALSAGKHVFVEKPLCLTLGDLAQLESVYSNDRLLMVGFNRRFAPQVVKIKSLLQAAPGPKALIMTVNAGAVPANHWTQDPDEGGGRIIGECCHFIDLLRHLVGHPVTAWDRNSMACATRDTVTLNLQFADGSTGAIHYFANGAKSFPKERLEVFASAGVLQLDNFRRLTGFGWPGFKKMNLWQQDKGQKACAESFLNALRSGGPAPIPVTEIFEVSRISIELAQM
jgi:predicted dehydrogenase